jgi:hypothetical protein
MEESKMEKMKNLRHWCANKEDLLAHIWNDTGGEKNRA